MLFWTFSYFLPLSPLVLAGEGEEFFLRATKTMSLVTKFYPMRFLPITIYFLDLFLRIILTTPSKSRNQFRVTVNFSAKINGIGNDRP